MVEWLETTPIREPVMSSMLATLHTEVAVAHSFVFHAVVSTIYVAYAT